MMLIRLTRNLLLHGEHHAAGEEIEVNQRVADVLIGMKKAVPADTEAADDDAENEPETTEAKAAPEKAVTRKRPATKRRSSN